MTWKIIHSCSSHHQADIFQLAMFDSQKLLATSCYKHFHPKLSLFIDLYPIFVGDSRQIFMVIPHGKPATEDTQKPCFALFPLAENSVAQMDRKIAGQNTCVAGKSPMYLTKRFPYDNLMVIWVCLKIVYLYTQWLMIITPTKWLSLGVYPIFRHTHLMVI